MWYVVHYGQWLTGPFQTQELAERSLEGLAVNFHDPEGLSVVQKENGFESTYKSGVLPPWSGDWR